MRRICERVVVGKEVFRTPSQYQSGGCDFQLVMRSSKIIAVRREVTTLLTRSVGKMEIEVPARLWGREPACWHLPCIVPCRI